MPLTSLASDVDEESNLQKLGKHTMEREKGAVVRSFASPFSTCCTLSPPRQPSFAKHAMLIASSHSNSSSLDSLDSNSGRYAVSMTQASCERKDVEDEEDDFLMFPLSPVFRPRPSSERLSDPAKLSQQTERPFPRWVDYASHSDAVGCTGKAQVSPYNNVIRHPGGDDTTEQVHQVCGSPTVLSLPALRGATPFILLDDNDEDVVQEEGKPTKNIQRIFLTKSSRKRFRSPTRTTTLTIHKPNTHPNKSSETGAAAAERGEPRGPLQVDDDRTIENETVKKVDSNLKRGRGRPSLNKGRRDVEARSVNKRSTKRQQEQVETAATGPRSILSLLFERRGFPEGECQLPSITALPAAQQRAHRQAIYQALSPLFDERAFHTRKGFEEAVRRCFTATHVLTPGVFWRTFASSKGLPIRFIGEGSFGLVWQCSAASPVLGAPSAEFSVKSCPLRVSTKAQREDALTTLREVAIMHQLQQLTCDGTTPCCVPHVLPLYSAFYVPGSSEALPPEVCGAMQWRRECRKRCEALAAAELMIQDSVPHHKRKPCAGVVIPDDAEVATRHEVQSPARGRRGKKEVDRRFEELVEEYFYVRLPQLEACQSSPHYSPEAINARQKYSHVVCPDFLALSAQEALQSDATLFLVTCCCSGDVEKLVKQPRPSNASTSGSISPSVASASAWACTDGDARRRRNPRLQHPKRRSMGFSLLLSIGMTLAEALSGLHALGLIHLDIKPSNVLYVSSDNALKNGNTLPHFFLSDYGNCRLLPPLGGEGGDILEENKENKENKEIIRGAIGTYAYMDLRALQSLEVCAATDCFSLGATLFELAFCRRVYGIPLRARSNNRPNVSSLDCTAHSCVPKEGDKNQENVVEDAAVRLSMEEFDDEESVEKDREWYLRLARAFYDCHWTSFVDGATRSSLPPKLDELFAPRRAIDQQAAAAKVVVGAPVGPSLLRGRDGAAAEEEYASLARLFHDILARLLDREWGNRMTAAECAQMLSRFTRA